MDAEVAGYLAQAAYKRAHLHKQAAVGAFMKNMARHAGVGAATGAAAGALNSDGQTSLGTRLVRGAVGGAVGGAVLGGMAVPATQRIHRHFSESKEPIPQLDTLGKNIVGGLSGIIGGVANTT